MEFLIKKILRESDFDWIKEVPSFIEITEPVAQKNPKNKFRLHWTNGHGEDASTWSDNWFVFNNDNQGVDGLTRYIKILQNGFANGPYLNTWKLAELYVGGGHDYIVNDWMEQELDNLVVDGEFEGDEIKHDLSEWLYEDLADMGILSWDSYNDDNATVERWWVTYFDEAGVEYKTKINKA